MIIPKKWRVKASDPAMQFILSRKLGVSPLMAQLLINRGIFTAAAAKDFLDVDLSGLHSPMLMRDMDRGVELAARALETRQKILVYGDYDVDGVTGTTLLVTVLRRLGGEVDYYIPHRLDLGYGLHTKVLKQARENGVGLIITVDCGISNAAEVAESLAGGGPEIIITDHHEPPAELPPAAAVINPKRHDCNYPFRELAGVGVAYKFALALLEKKACPIEPEEYLDLVCLGTVADIVPLNGENRILVKHGLAKLARFERPGLKALYQVCGLKNEFPGTREVGYILAPRLNAAGRLGDAGTAVDLLLSDDLESALELAAELVRNNQTRQELESVALGEALGMLDGDPSLAADRVLVLASSHWHPGVIGIVASRLVDRYHKPALLLACEGERGKGSARSIKGFDLMPALEYCSGCLLEYGGHSMAAGISLKTDQIDRFRVSINEYAAGVLDNEKQPDTLELDALVSLQDVTHELVNEIEMLQPHGHGNPSPILGTPCAKLLQCRGVGKNEAHLKIKLGESRANIDGIGFNLGKYVDELATGSEISVAFTPTINDWQGRSYLQIRVNDLQGEAQAQLANNNIVAEDYFHQAKELIFIPETMLARLRDYLTQNCRPMPGELSLLKLDSVTGEAGSQTFPGPVPSGESGDNLLTRLEIAEKCILLLVNSARHTLQLARYFEYHPRFTGLVSYINCFMSADRIADELHKVTNGTVKLLVSTYACNTGKLGNKAMFDRIIMARPPATREDWLNTSAGLNNDAAIDIKAAYNQDDWQKNQIYLDELAPEREALAGFYTVLRSMAPKGTGSCTVSEAVTRMCRSGHSIASSMLPTVAAAIFKDLGLLQYHWEEDMLKYKILPAGGQRRELNESGTFIWTRGIKTEWLDWIESRAQSNGA
ncbi:MAG TPA: single-stranded-DNA-specific exonuclease RecJ [Desulfotomaculum sp.]|nr:MAG: hypothetical protein JL56_05420 [Desulfotomaculum sp. BICA1-6]HBX22337.1 single-stranded-DNA-specific exonuclease RecJ [Desulfotomaculum sp.]